MSQQEELEKKAEQQKEVVERIEKSLNKIRPYIQADGGDVELVGFDDGIVTVTMLGACAGCMAINTTLDDGIKALLMDEVPEVKDVHLVAPADLF